MEIDGWFSGYRLRSFPWIDGKTIYFNVRYYAPGQSIERPPVFDKSVYVTDNEAGRRLVSQFTESLALHVAGLEVKPGIKIVLTA